MIADAIQGSVGIALAALGVGLWIGWPAGLCALGVLIYMDLLRGRASQ